MAPRVKNLNRSLVNEAVASFAARIVPGSVVLDVGAGSGHYRGTFTGHHYIAVDRGYESNDLRGLDVGADIRFLPLSDCSVDALICVEVIEHVPDVDELFAEMFRVLKPGGMGLVTSPLCYGEHMQPYDFQRYTRFALQNHFRAAGFEVVDIQPRGGMFTLLAYLLARVPDELLREQQRRMLGLPKLLLRLATTYTLAPLFAVLDRFDRRKHFTLGFVSLLRKPG